MVGEVGPCSSTSVDDEDDGLWALCETAFFAVLQAPVGAVFASMGATASTAPRGAPVAVLGPRRGTDATPDSRDRLGLGRPSGPCRLATGHLLARSGARLQS